MRDSPSGCSTETCTMATKTRNGMEGTERDERLFISSLEKGLKVLEAFEDMTTELGLQQIADAAGQGKSGAQRLVYTLLQLGYLRRNPVTRKYRLSSKVFLRGYALVQTSDLVREAHDELVSINKECGDTCVLAMLEGAEIVVLSSIPGRHIDSLNVTVGMRFPANLATSGLMLLAWLSPEEVKSALDLDSSQDDDAARKFSALQAELASIREQRVCVTKDALMPGNLSISAPVFDAAGRAIAAINVSTPKDRYPSADAIHNLSAIIVAGAEAVSARLGYTEILNKRKR
ncbi:IclR family transcriptional regulator [Paraburkholderia sp.]|uniref:IclR family transcriptional regulator n=1 Tax=Paraburkholderia sp. TaxID=1926495 RepID=UPI0039E367D8